MRTKSVMLFALLLVTFSHLYGQGVNHWYSYDANGNRISRAIIVQKIMAVKFPVATFEDISSQEVAPDFFIKVYPNPTKGILSLEISGLDYESFSRYGVYNLKGSLLKTGTILSPIMDIDITNLNDGLYILMIQIGKKRYDWKIMKSGYR